MLCKRFHSISVCPKFFKMQPVERCRTVRQFKYCVNCLAKSHTAAQCKSKNKCRKCRNCHHTMLHPNKPMIYTGTSVTNTKRQQKNHPKQRKSQHTQQQQPRHHKQQKSKRIGQKAKRNTSIQPFINQTIISDAIRSLATVLCATHQNDHF